MLFSKERTPRNELRLQMDEDVIIEVYKTKFLGVIIDNKFNWKDHISYICGKISKGIGMIIKARNCVNKDSLMALYYSFVYPYLMYCNHIWGSIYKTNLRQLVILHNKVVCVISYVKPRNSADHCVKHL